MSAATTALRARWTALAPRERRLVSLAALLIGLALLWWVALAPALRTLAAARTEHGRLDAQLQQMRTLQAQAQALQSQPRANRGDAMKALETAVRGQLGPNAQLQSGGGGGEGVNLSVKGVPGDVLAQWLAQARGNARAVPREVHLTRATDAAPAGGPAARGGAVNAGNVDDGGAKVRWDGTLVMSLPAPR